MLVMLGKDGGTGKGGGGGIRGMDGGGGGGRKGGGGGYKEWGGGTVRKGMQGGVSGKEINLCMERIVGKGVWRGDL